MSDQPDATSDHDAVTTAATAPVTVEQAAAILGVSVTTVRRRIRAGVLRAEEARRAQGPVWLVYLPADATSATTEPPPATSSVATAPTTAEAMATYTRSILEPLVATIERQAERIEGLALEVGELRAENRALEARTAAQTPEPTAEPPTPPFPVWVAWSPTVALLVVTLVLAVLLLVRYLLLGAPR
jgi:excisionase family DNA binding protein